MCPPRAARSIPWRSAPAAAEASAFSGRWIRHMNFFRMSGDVLCEFLSHEGDHNLRLLMRNRLRKAPVEMKVDDTPHNASDSRSAPCWLRRGCGNPPHFNSTNPCGPRRSFLRWTWWPNLSVPGSDRAANSGCRQLYSRKLLLKSMALRAPLVPGARQPKSALMLDVAIHAGRIKGLLHVVDGSVMALGTCLVRDLSPELRFDGVAGSAIIRQNRV